MSIPLSLDEKKRIAVEYLQPLREAIRRSQRGEAHTVLCMARSQWRQKLHCGELRRKAVGRSRRFPSLASQANYIREWSRRNATLPEARVALRALEGLALLGENPHGTKRQRVRRSRQEWESRAHGAHVVADASIGK